MLPPALASLKKKLEETMSGEPSLYEVHLFDELSFLDQNRDIGSLIERSGIARHPAIVTYDNSDVCKHCGAKINA